MVVTHRGAHLSSLTGCWLWYGGCEGSVCDFGCCQDAQEQRHQRPLRDPSSSRKVSNPRSILMKRALLTLKRNLRMPGQCNVLLAEASVPYDSECYCS